MAQKGLLYGKIILGTFCMALAVNLIYEPIGMVTGGISGLAITIKAIGDRYLAFDFPIWLSNLVLNIPIFIWAYFVKGKQFLRHTFFANICFTIFLGVLPSYSLADKDYFLAAITGGTLTGVGLGFVFASGCSTGGTDLLGSVLKHYIKSVPVANLLFVIDAMVILSGMFLFGIPIGIYAIFAVFLSSKLMDNILSGLKQGKQVMIISDHYDLISREIMGQLDRGVTCLEGKGMYSGNRRKVVLCVVGKREIVKLLQIIKDIDKKAFIILQDAKEIMGEGFEEIG